MGRKRTSNKIRIAISIDKDLLKEFDQHCNDRSEFFTGKVTEYINHLEESNSNRESVIQQVLLTT